MKEKKILLIIGLALLLGATTVVWAAFGCSDYEDCESLWGGIDDFCYKNNYVFNATGTFYDCITGSCQISSPKYPFGDVVDANCSQANSEACSNRNLYSISWSCTSGGCLTDATKTLKAANSPKCDPALACTGIAHKLSTAPSNLTYNPDFTGVHLVDAGEYVVAPGNTLYVDNIGWMLYWCGNGVEANRTSNLFVWVYNSSNGQRLARGQNNINIAAGVDREDLIGPTSQTRAEPITNAWTMVYDYYMENEEINNIYTFNNPSRYTVYIDVISAYCIPNFLGFPLTQNYVCPWRGGRPAADLCHFWAGEDVEGWTHLENFSVIVPGPNINFTAPANQTSPAGTTIQKTWIINNTGIGKIKMNITYNCGNWTCAFNGYTAGSQVPLNENQVFTVTLNITLGAAEVNHRIGINVSYDEGYGLAAIAPARKTSNISITSTGAAAAWVNVALNQPAAGSTVPNNVTLNYTITGTNSTYNVSLNLNGSANYQTGTGKQNGILNSFVLTNLAPGFYKWNVTAYINGTVYNTSQTWNFTVAAPPAVNVSWVNVTLNQPADWGVVPSNVTLNYTILGSNNTYNVSLNLNGSANNQTGTGKLNNTLYGFNVVNLNPGLYWWNVTAYINSSVYTTSETRIFFVNFTSTPAPWVKVNITQPEQGSVVKNNLTLNYTITGTNNTYNSSLNLNGTEGYLVDIGRLNNTPYNFTLSNLAAGVYTWNVTGYINSTVHNTSDTWGFTVEITPGGTLFYIT
jgi:hypothetical protein